jgi:Flp pilus assembly protein TadD
MHAEAAAREAITLDPHSAQAHYNLGYLLETDPARALEAEAAYRQAIALEPNNPRPIYRLGLLLHEQLQRPAEAETAYRRAIDLAPDNPFYHGGLVSLLVQQSRRPEAQDLAGRMRPLLTAGKLWYGLATLEALLGNTEAAIEHLRRAAREGKINHEWARNDPDLASIRDDPRFKMIIGAE